MAEEKLSQLLNIHFGFRRPIEKVILQNVYVGSMANATLFFDAKGYLLLFIASKTRLKLAEVQKIVSRMGMKARIFLPPMGDTAYFNTIAREKFAMTFPGKKIVHADDLAYYRTLVPYNPALVVIGEVKNGVVKVFDSESPTGWRDAVNLSYNYSKTR
ncbi:MAG: hypothetical protein LBM97_02500 [Candidatus Nomurabacteria bacterium]|jgi:hypothetical protein|nr:hypothetical protein [Candidatus Nomurabacteria bacterium]